jgi:two-component system NtrC family sensor kinase
LAGKGVYRPDQTWKHNQVELADVIVSTVTLSIIALVAWLSSREITKLLRRAQASERELRHQRDQLEVLVEKRTRELRRAQVESLSQIYHFAELGRATSGLFHDLATPLNVVSLNLNKLAQNKVKQGMTDTQHALDRAIIGVNRLESYIISARRQVQNQEVLEKFSINKEVELVLQFLQHQIKQNHLQITTEWEKDFIIYGNPIKFSQLVANLIKNAIDAYDTIERKDKRIIALRLFQKDRMIKLEVQDHGIGIPKRNLSKIFTPLYTTKAWNKGTGIGLSLSKDIIEKDFKSTLTVESEEGKGTTFSIALKSGVGKQP